MKAFEKQFDGFQYVLTKSEKIIAKYFWEAALKYALSLKATIDDRFVPVILPEDIEKELQD